MKTNNSIHSLTIVSLLALALAAASGCATGVEQDEEITASDTAEVSLRPRFALWKSTSGQFYFHLKSANGEILLASESYQTRLAALNGVLSVLDNGGFTGSYEVKAAQNGQYYFNLLAANKQVIGSSELYTTEFNARAGVQATVNAVGQYLAHWDSGVGARFRVFAGSNGRFYFNLHAKNGSIVMSSQAYDDEAVALNGCFAVAEFGKKKSAYKVLQASNGQWYVNLYASNGQVIGTTETYANKQNAERARDAIIALLPSVALL